MTQYRISADVGGTFTDIFVMNEATGEISIHKVPSSPGDPSEGIIEGILQTGVPLDQLRFFSHGTTVGTNALITRNFPDAALVATEGFRDILEIRDSTKSSLWDAYWDMPPPYIRRRDRFEVKERVAFDGSVIKPLDEAGVRNLARVLRRRNVQTIAVCLIHSYANDAHERKIKEIFAEELPDVPVTLSCDVLPEMFEFPRVSTTVVNAILVPVTSRYMRNLSTRLRDKGYEGSLLVLHSGGGVMTADAAEDYAARMAASGLAGGAVAMEHIAKMCGFENAIGLDVGGTSTDISMMYKGEVRITQDLFVEPGYPIRFPSIELITIGAGGGSISWIDEGGALRNGPQSAGATPGPACYGSGGVLPTNTDANLVLGRLGEALIGGAMTLDRKAAAAVINEHVAGPLGMDLHSAASSVIKIADANMSDAVRLVSVQKGYDPNDFVLVAFGGAGPLHAVAVARNLAIPTVIIPLYPGIASAMGCALVDMRHDVTRTIIVPADENGLAQIGDIFENARTHLVRLLEAEGIPEKSAEFRSYLSMRYVGQFRSLVVSVDLGSGIDSILSQFHQEHGREFGYSQTEQAVEIIAIRLTGLGKLEKPRFPILAAADGPAPASGKRDVYFDEASGFVESLVYQRDRLRAGHVVHGPAIVEQLDSTIVMPPGCEGRVEKHGNIIIKVG